MADEITDKDTSISDAIAETQLLKPSDAERIAIKT